MALDLDLIEALAKQATPGPWERSEYDQGIETENWIFGQNKDGSISTRHSGKLSVLRDFTGRRKRLNEDLDYIAHMHPGRALELVAEVRRLSAAYDAMVEWAAECECDAHGGWVAGCGQCVPCRAKQEIARWQK